MWINYNTSVNSFINNLMLNVYSLQQINRITKKCNTFKI